MFYVAAAWIVCGVIGAWLFIDAERRYTHVTYGAVLSITAISLVTGPMAFVSSFIVWFGGSELSRTIAFRCKR